MGTINTLSEKASSAPSNANSTASIKIGNKIASVEEFPNIIQENQEAVQDGDEPIYPTTFNLTLIVSALCLSVFCVAIDNTILATAIPKITDQFHTLNDVGWYASGYLLTSCTFQLIFGKLYTFHSIKLVYLSSLAVFEIGSLLCAVAPSSPVLIFGRVVAGVGSAGVYAGAFIIVIHIAPLHKRPIYTSVVGTMYGVACVAGPLMGGAFTDNPKLTWRWCFYINLPLGFATAVFIAIFFVSPERRKTGRVSILHQLKQMDLPGTACFLPGVVCLLLTLQWGGTKYEWHSGRIIALLVLAILLLISFLVIQIYSGENATVPTRVFGNRNVWGSALFGICMNGSFFMMMFFMPIWFQAVKEVSAIKSGIMNIPLILGFVLISVMIGGLTTVVGYYVPFIYLCIICQATGAGLLTTLTVDSGHSQWIGYQFLFGAGVGFGLQQTLIAVQTALPLRDAPIGIAIIMFAQTFGSTLFVSVGQNVFNNLLLQNLSKYVSGLDPQIILKVGATQLKDQVPKESYSAVLFAYNKALTNSFYAAVALPCIGTLAAVWIQWLSVKAKKAEVTTNETGSSSSA